jgi:serine protease Do
MSGGPTVNYQGQVIGTNSFFPTGESQSFNFVGTSQRILELMASNGVSNELSEDTVMYRKGIDAYFAGDKATAVADLAAVKENQPSNALVNEYLDRAQALADAPAPAAADTSDGGGVPMWVWVAVAALLLLAGAGFVLGRNRRGKTQPAFSTGYPVQPTQPPMLERQSAPAQWSPAPQLAPVAPTEPVDPTSTVQTQVMPAASEQELCPNCRQPVEANKRFCGECGAPQ